MGASRISVVLFVASVIMWGWSIFSLHHSTAKPHSGPLAASNPAPLAAPPAVCKAPPPPSSAEASMKVRRPDGTYADKKHFPFERRSLFLLASQAVGVEHPSAGSQFFQDEAVFKLAFANEVNGPVGAQMRFVEFGASDGFYNSNTIFFEKAFGWRGLLLEGDPQLVAQAQGVRGRSQVVNTLVCVQPASVIFARFNVMGLSAIMTEEAIEERLKKDREQRGTLKLEEKLSIKCDTLESILLSNGYKKDEPIALLSIDVEGLVRCLFSFAFLFYFLIDVLPKIGAGDCGEF
jgi:hypothetical protein